MDPAIDARALCRRGSCWVNDSWPFAVNQATMHAYAAERAVNRHTRQGGIGIALRLARLYGSGDPWTAKVLSLSAVSAVLAALEAPAGGWPRGRPRVQRVDRQAAGTATSPQII